MMENKWIDGIQLLQNLNFKIDSSAMKVVRRFVESAEPCNVLERDEGKEPVLEEGEGGMFVDYADGTGEYKETHYLDWKCPTCGWFVGELYSGYGRWHIQRESSYCARCGQKIDWTKPTEESKRRYEERKQKEREKHEKMTGYKLDNMNEHMREKYGELGRD